MRIHHTRLRMGITRTREFEKKRLAMYAVNVGTKCGHGCLYCSTGALLRMHRSFKETGENPFEGGYAIVDPTTPDRVARDARRITRRGIVQLCTIVDAWAPEAQEQNLGRRCLEALLSEPGWVVRILTKNAKIAEDYDLISRHRDRVLVGLSITATSDKDSVMSIVEPNASTISMRIAALREAHRLGLRTYAMFCPLLPGIADSPDQMDAIMRLAADCHAEEIFVEPVNSRGPGLRQTQEALAANGLDNDAHAIGRVRQGNAWSQYAVDLLGAAQRAFEPCTTFRH